MDKILTWLGSKTSVVIHTILFTLVFILGILTGSWEMLLLILTTLVSLEAIYLSIFIQYGVNKTNDTIQEVSEDIEEISEDDEDYDKTLEDIKRDIQILIKKLEGKKLK